jgi:hypothetical protein
MLFSQPVSTFSQFSVSGGNLIIPDVYFNFAKNNKCLDENQTGCWKYKRVFVCLSTAKQIQLIDGFFLHLKEKNFSRQ